LKSTNVHGAELVAVRVHDNNRVAMNMMGLTNSGDKRGGVHRWVADADASGLAGKTFVADINVIVARCQIIAGELAQSDVEIAGCVGKERTITIGYVIVAGCVAKEGLNTNSRIAVTGCAAKEGLSTSGRVVGTGCVAIERLTTGGRVIVAACIAKKRLKTFRGISIAPVTFIGIRWSRWACRTCCSSRAGCTRNPLITFVTLRSSWTG
jgi:hypothetical protein